MSSRANEFGQPVGAPLDTWTPRDWPDASPMEGRFCRLERLDADRHAAALFRAYAEAPDGRDWTYLMSERPIDPRRFAADTIERAKSRDPLFFTIEVGGEPLGTASLMRIDPANGTIEIGHITYSPRLKRTTAGTEAIVLLMRRAFESGYRRVEWKCDSLNAPSRAAALRYGFGFEGVFRQALVTKGRNRDTAWYSVTDQDWPIVRQAFDLWLAPDNFDAAGRQKSTLVQLRGVVTADGV